jgi:DNA-directed RNA polymerase specialized sigma24 family protein
LHIPSNMTEEEVIETIERVATRLCRKFRFGYHEVDDIKQQASLFAWEGLEKYDEKRPLENFLWTHVRNRLYNFKRNNYSRPEKPCDTCEFFKNQKCLAFDRQDECALYKGWCERNNAKKSLMKSVTLEFEQNEHNESFFSTLFTKEVFEIIDIALPVSLREDWIRFINNLKLSKNRRTRLLEEINLIVEEHNIDKETW